MQAETHDQAPRSPSDRHLTYHPAPTPPRGRTWAPVCRPRALPAGLSPASPNCGLLPSSRRALLGGWVRCLPSSAFGPFAPGSPGLPPRPGSRLVPWPWLAGRVGAVVVWGLWCPFPPPCPLSPHHVMTGERDKRAQGTGKPGTATAERGPDGHGRPAPSTPTHPEGRRRDDGREPQSGGVALRAKDGRPRSPTWRRRGWVVGRVADGCGAETGEQGAGRAAGRERQRDECLSLRLPLSNRFPRCDVQLIESAVRAASPKVYTGGRRPSPLRGSPATDGPRFYWIAVSSLAWKYG